MCNYYRDEPNVFPANNHNVNPIRNSKSFKYKTSIIGKISNQNQENDERENVKTIKNRNRCAIKKFKHFLEKFRYATDQLSSIFNFNLVLKLCFN